MNNIALGKFIPGNSFIHKLDPRSKIFIMILLMVFMLVPVWVLRFQRQNWMARILQPVDVQNVMCL